MESNLLTTTPTTKFHNDVLNNPLIGVFTKSHHVSAVTAEIIAGTSLGATTVRDSAQRLLRRLQIIGKLNPSSATPATIKSPPQRSSWAWRTGNLAAASAATAPSAIAIIPKIRNTVASVCEIRGSVMHRGGKDSVSLLFGTLVLRDRANS